MRLADPRPSLCTLCCNSGHEKTRFVDTLAHREGPLVRDKETGEIAVDSSGAQIQLDDVLPCDDCVADQFKVLAQADPEWARRVIKELAPEVYREWANDRFSTERRLQLAAEHWRDTAKRKDEELRKRDEYITQLETAAGSMPKPRRKAA